MKLRWPTMKLAVILMLAANASARAQQSTQDLAEAAQNPIAAMISLPIQNNIYGEVGPNHNATGNVLNIQPVVPITLGDWNIISRTIAPLIYQPSLATLPSETFELGQFSSSHSGLGDINQSFLFSPADATGLIWGVGPTFNLPTATATALGSAKFSMGPEVVALVIPRPFLIGALAPDMVGCRSFESARCEPAADTALRQLQHGRRLVPGELADHCRELGSAIEQVGFSDRRRRWQDFQN